MGRRKKVEIDSTSNLFSNNIVGKNNYYQCDICKEYSRIPLIKLNLSHSLGKASYHRLCCLDNPKVCDKCASEISNIIDNWIISKNSSLEKFK